MAWWQYLLLVNIYLVLFYGFYVLLLKKETFFRLNRIYLISSAVLSFVIPIIQTDWVHSLFITQKINQTIYSLNEVTIYPQPQQAVTSISIGQVLAVVYIVGTAVLLLKLLVQLMKLKQAFNSPATSNAFSFFGKVKINKELPDEDVIASHEAVHARQWHSADVLLIEIVTIINWFNPIVYLYRKAIKHIHEFIADSEVVSHGTDRQDYAILLLSQTLNVSTNQLANSFFNHSLLKQRIMMLNKNPSQRKALLKYGLSAPLFALMVILSSATAKTKTAITAINKTAAQVMQFKTIVKTDDDSHITTITTTEKRLPAMVAQKVDAPTAEAAPEKKMVFVMMTDTIGKGPVFTSVEHSATPTGGMEALYQFLANNIRYPAEARKNNVQGRVICQFIIEQDGSLDEIKVVRGVGSGLDEEATRVLAISPKWKPGVQNGHIIRQQYTIPIAFTIDGAPKSDGSGQRKDPPPPPTSSSTSPQMSLNQVVVTGRINKDTLKRAKVFVVDVPLSPEYYVNGKLATSETWKSIDPKDIESINVIKAKDGSFATKDQVWIKTKKK